MADAVAGAAAGPDLPGWARRELRAWALLAVGALAIAGVFALLLAISRIPGVEAVFPWPVGFFHKGLVIHVVFSFVVWFLAVFGVLLVLATVAAGGNRPRFAAAGPAAIGGVAVSGPMLFVPALLDRGEATLNNYVPTIIDPLYYGGLVVLALGVGLAALRLLVNLGRRPSGSAPTGGTGQSIVAPMATAAVIYFVALLCFGLAAAALRGQTPSHAFNEEMFWGGGHVLQILNTQMLIVAWLLLAAVAFRRPPDGRPHRAVATVLLLAATAAAPLFYFVFPPFSADQTEAFTALQWALGPAAVIAAAGLAPGWRRRRSWREPALKCLVLSALVFAVGGLFGVFVDGADTRTPAHYHGVIAGVTLAFMGLFLAVVLPALERGVTPGKRVAVQIYCFAFGQLAACIGLFLAGGFGAPRKTAGDAQGLEGWGQIVGMGLNGLGGLVAVGGGVLFIWTMATALLGRRGARPTAAADPTVAAAGGSNTVGREDACAPSIQNP